MAAPVAEDYYAVLGVGVGVGDAELRRAWRRLAAECHPDRAGVGATARFQRLSAAYTVLSDPVARAAYDRRRGMAATEGAGRRREAAAATAATAPASVRQAGRASAPGVMLSRVTGNLSGLLARGAARFDEPGFITLVLSEREAAQGGMAQISMTVELWCPDCAAQGRSAARCARCGGRGTVDELYSAWLAVRPGATAGEVLVPSAELRGMVEPVRFRVRFNDS